MMRPMRITGTFPPSPLAPVLFVTIDSFLFLFSPRGCTRFSRKGGIPCRRSHRAITRPDAGEWEEHMNTVNSGQELPGYQDIMPVISQIF
jgi:hypothetical protein